jgi:hypothetical protein
MHIKKDYASGGEDNPVPLFRSVRTGRHTYAIADDGRWLLYDNVEDPYQMHNLIDDPSRAKLAREMEGPLRDWLKAAEDPYPCDAITKKRSSLAA